MEDTGFSYMSHSMSPKDGLNKTPDLTVSPIFNKIITEEVVDEVSSFSSTSNRGKTKSKKRPSTPQRSKILVEQQPTCVICDKLATDHCTCSPRHAYCSTDHQLQHWEEGHYQSHDEDVSLFIVIITNI